MKFNRKSISQPLTIKMTKYNETLFSECISNVYKLTLHLKVLLFQIKFRKQIHNMYTENLMK